MPNRNGSGPMGAGPMTGRGMGRCATGAASSPQGGPSGQGMGRGGGRGRCGGFAARRGSQGSVQQSTEDNAAALEREAELLETRLSGLRQRLDALNGRKGKP